MNQVLRLYDNTKTHSDSIINYTFLQFYISAPGGKGLMRADSGFEAFP